MPEAPANILTIAGSDSGGGAGIQADVKTATVLGAFGLSVITALTAQNGAEVRGIYAPTPAFVLEQLNTVLDGFPIAAAKTGMLFSAGIMEVLSSRLAKRDFPLVVDPVAVSQSGHRLLQEDALEAMRRKILPLADLLTPNRPEAEVLSGIPINSTGAMAQAAARLQSLGAKAVLIKGGHFAEGETGVDSQVMTDWLFFPGGRLLALPHSRVDTHNNHGTGCTLSAAIATFWGQGARLEEAVRKAQSFLLRALEHSFAPGLGAGPPNVLAGAGSILYA